MMRGQRIAAVSVLLFAACSGGGLEDGGTSPDGSAVADAGTSTRDGGGASDAESTDSGLPALDAGPREASLAPGSHIDVAEGRIEVVADSFDSVRRKLGSGRRSSGPGARSYEWTLSGGVELTVWFANTNLDADDSVDVDGEDKVLWVAVTGGFSGATPEGVRIGSERSAVERAYGAAPNSVDLREPAGSLAQYFQRGLLVAYGQDGRIRTLTICRSYPVAPSGTADVVGMKLELEGLSLNGFRIGQNGSALTEITDRLGAPDARGDLMVSGQSLTTLSYGFIGLEFFVVPMLGSDRVAFFNLHAPYYGTVLGQRLGALRSDLETALTQAGFLPGRPSSTNLSFVCYETPAGRRIGVTYTESAPALFTSVTFPLLRCP